MNVYIYMWLDKKTVNKLGVIMRIIEGVNGESSYIMWGRFFHVTQQF